MFCVRALILNEVFFLSNGGLPTSKDSIAIGQWGSWVGVALTIIAAANFKV